VERILGDLTRRETYQAGLTELVGTGLLTFAALLAGTPYAVALILAALVYALGPLSGAQLNPAVTLGLLATRRISAMKAVLYLDAQIIGALLAAQVAPAIGQVPGSHQAGRAVGEFVGAGLLVLVAIAVIEKRVPEQAGGVAIGAALGAGLLLSGGVLNPAVAMAMGLGRSPALWAAALGGVAFAVLYRLLSAEQERTEEETEGQVEEEDDRETPVATAHPIVVRRPATRRTPQRPQTRARAGHPDRALANRIGSLIGNLARWVFKRRQDKPVTRRARLADLEMGD
jgi:aquaporin Z